MLGTAHFTSKKNFLLNCYQCEKHLLTFLNKGHHKIISQQASFEMVNEHNCQEATMYESGMGFIYLF